MKYFKCLNCEFNVTTEDKRCPNCGVLYPLKSFTEKEAFKEKEFRDNIAGVLITIFILLLIPFYIYGFIYGFPNGFAGACGGGIGLIVLFYILSFGISALITEIAKVIDDRKIAKSRSEIKKRKNPHPESLTFKKSLIGGRISELRSRERELEPVLQNAKRITGEQKQQVIKTLESAIRMLKIHQARYVIKSLEIEIVRLQNKAAPLIYEVDNYSYMQIDSHLIKISEAQAKANELLKRVEDQKYVLGDVSEVKELSTRLSEINSSMIKLHDALIGRQAVLALQKVKPMDNFSLDTFSNVSPIKAIRESEIFNIQGKFPQSGEKYHRKYCNYINLYHLFNYSGSQF